jgi:ATP-dependent exoDNAse (exonuclease V) alpha subunit
MKQAEALEILKMGHNVFLTGPAGSGKTHVLNEYIKYLRERGIAVGVTASTGIAATHMDGITIHSWAGIGIKDRLNEKEIEKLIKKKYISDRMVETRVLIIDEISMLHHFRLDLVDEVCRAVRGIDKPFGGLQVILSGDFFQLPPISRGDELAYFVHRSKVWNEMDLKICYLGEQHRQEDQELLKVLYDIRTNNVTEETLIPLRLRYRKEIEGDISVTKLYTHNADVDIINEQELDKLKGEEMTYYMDGSGHAALVDILKKGCLAPELLRLREGAVVMFVKNKFDQGYVNGTTGVVERFDETGMPVVRLRNGKVIFVTTESWMIDEEGETKAAVYQLPLRLAWAITIHKSQGMSLDAAEVDLSKSFAPGMGYVALSRVRSLSGLKLMGFNEMSKKVSEEVLEHDEELRDRSDKAAEELKDMKDADIAKKQIEFLGGSTRSTSSLRQNSGQAGQTKKKKISTYEQTKFLVEEKYSLEDMVREREMSADTILGHLEKLKERGDLPNIEHLSLPKKQMTAILAAFKKTDDIRLTPVRELLKNKYSFEQLRVVRLFL